MKYNAFRSFWTWNFLVLILLLLFLAGCSENRQFGHPSLEPAPAHIQKQRAVRFDPYPDPNLGPEIPGARPHNYTTPSLTRNTGTRLDATSPVTY
ncbi:MAG: hypothetical protein Q4C70_10520 [Planctomycetia bacterium]|nr:hypothetical protein [Planctomycetia bacterium]